MVSLILPNSNNNAYILSESNIFIEVKKRMTKLPSCSKENISHAKHFESGNCNV